MSTDHGPISNTEHTTPSPTEVLQAALDMGGLGFKIVPIPIGEKFPRGLPRWQERATNDALQIAEWWGGDEQRGIGWAMGRQPNGMNLVAVDVDQTETKDGYAVLKTWLDEHPTVAPHLIATVCSDTGGGGAHFILALPDDVEITNSRWLDGVDIRGEGGFIVIPPSIHPSGNPYTWRNAPGDTTVQPAPPELIEALLPTLAEFFAKVEAEGGATLNSIQHRQLVEGERATLLRRAGGDPTPSEWVRDNVPISALLTEDGWTCSTRRGEDTYWTRPGKKHTDGHSAVLHGEAPFIIWSTSAPGSYWRVGRDNGDGSKSLSPLDVYAAVHFSGDLRGASSHVRRNLMTAQASPTSVLGGTRPDVRIGESEEDEAAPQEEDAPLNLPPEFWSSRPLLTQIRNAAHSMLVSPDAVLGALLTRYAATIHPSIVLPGHGSLDIFAIIAGHSGAGKSKAARCARLLFPIDNTRVLRDRPVGSGEGLIEAYFRWVDEDGEECHPNKNGARKVQWFWGSHFTTDEGVALTEQAGRSGAIIIPTLCQAWMGETLGQQNAGAETTRVIPPGHARMTAQINIQTVNGFKLFSDVYAATGLSQRMLCFSATDPTIHALYGGDAPAPLPAWPGPLDLPAHYIVTGSNRTIDVAEPIMAGINQRLIAAHSPTWAGNPLDTHADLTRLKLGAMFSLLDGRFSVTENDWGLASSVLAAHRAVRSLLQQTKLHADQAAHRSKVSATVDAAVALDEGRHKALVRSTVVAIERRLEAGKNIGRKHFSAAQREAYEEAMAVLEQQGIVAETERGWGPA